MRLKHAIIVQIENTDMLQRIEYSTKGEMCTDQAVNTKEENGR